MTLNSDTKFQYPDLAVSKMAWRIRWTFIKALKSPKSCTLMGFFSSKARKVLHEKAQKTYLSRHWRVMQSLKKNWLLVPKMTWGIWWILMRAVVSLKIWTSMCYFCWKHIMFELKKKYRGVMCHNTE